MFRDNTQQAKLRSTYLPLAGLSADRGKVTGQTEPLTYTDEAGEAWTFWALAPRGEIMGRKTVEDTLNERLNDLIRASIPHTPDTPYSPRVRAASVVRYSAALEKVAERCQSLSEVRGWGK